MESWRPQTELEEDIVAMHPEHNFIFGKLTDNQKDLQNGYQSRPKAHLDYLTDRSRKEKIERKEVNPKHIVNRMIGNDGLVMNDEELNGTDNVERETILMMRRAGLPASTDGYLNEAVTLPTYPINEKVGISRNGKKSMPIMLIDDFWAVESTRQRNAKKLEKIKFIENQMKGLPQNGNEMDSNNISVLNEDEVKKPTKAEIAVDQQQKYLDEYPKLGHHKTKMSNNKKDIVKTVCKKAKNKKYRKDELQLSSQLECSLSLSSNSSASSPSIYESCNSSLYFSITDSPNPNSQSISGYSQSNWCKNNGNSIKNNSFTPKELYNMKRRP